MAPVGVPGCGLPPEAAGSARAASRSSPPGALCWLWGAELALAYVLSGALDPMFVGFAGLGLGAFAFLLGGTARAVSRDSRSALRAGTVVDLTAPVVRADGAPRGLQAYQIGSWQFLVPARAARRVLGEAPHQVSIALASPIRAWRRSVESAAASCSGWTDVRWAACLASTFRRQPVRRELSGPAVTSKTAAGPERGRALDIGGGGPTLRPPPAVAEGGERLAERPHPGRPTDGRRIPAVRRQRAVSAATGYGEGASRASPSSTYRASSARVSSNPGPGALRRSSSMIRWASHSKSAKMSGSLL